MWKRYLVVGDMPLRNGSCPQEPLVDINWKGNIYFDPQLFYYREKKQNGCS